MSSGRLTTSASLTAVIPFAAWRGFQQLEVVPARRSPQGDTLPASVTTSEGSCLLQADIAHERVGVPMDELPGAATPAVNLGDA